MSLNWIYLKKELQNLKIPEKFFKNFEFLSLKINTLTVKV